jgi:hypothetical protein
MAEVDDGRRTNHPWQNFSAVRLCRLCGLVLAQSGPEYTIGVHVWCIHERNKLERKRIRTPTYGTILQGTDE